jgi:microcystin degradation protein MlrC
MPRRPVIAVAGLACETSSFSPARTLEPAFHPRRGDEIIEKYSFIQPGTPLGHAASWQGSLIGHALPGGVVTRDAFEGLTTEILSRLADIISNSETGIDGLWFDIHGAMCVEGIQDAEAELLRRIRVIIGAETIVSASMDLHGNVSQQLAHQTDLITCYRTAPHEDTMETKERACRHLVEILTSEPSEQRRPLKVWVQVPILLPGEQTSTRLEPAKGLYQLVPQVEATTGVLDAAIWVGYAWADEPRNHAVVVVTGWEINAVATNAKRLAEYFWKVRHEFHFAAPTGSLDDCLDQALISRDRPFFISDSGDNPTAGGSGDVTWGLSIVLSRPEFRHSTGPIVIYASIPGSEAVDCIAAAGIGETVTVTAGAEVDNIHHGPLRLTGIVHAIKLGDRDALVECVLRIGSVYVIITKQRKPYHYKSDLTELDLDPLSADIVVVKIGYLEPELFCMAANWMLALTPGGVDQDLVRLGHRQICRPMWPFDRSFPHAPSLTPQLIPMSNDSA